MSARLWVAPAAVSEEAAPEAVPVEGRKGLDREVPEAEGRIEALVVRDRIGARDRGNHSRAAMRNPSGLRRLDISSLHAADNDGSAVLDVGTGARKRRRLRIIIRFYQEIAAH